LKREEKAGNLAPRIPLEDAEVFPPWKPCWYQETRNSRLGYPTSITITSIVLACGNPSGSVTNFRKERRSPTGN
jgi:hypothetical protein